MGIVKKRAKGGQGKSDATLRVGDILMGAPVCFKNDRAIIGSSSAGNEWFGLRIRIDGR
jgi:hypothetical protein